MSKLRENIWFLSSFGKKYLRLIIVSLVVTVLIVFGLNIVLQSLPKSKETIRVGIVGQFNANQLPNRVLTILDAGLISFNEKHEPVPNIAEKWSVSEDGLSYTFTLFPDKQWSDGKQLIASDIKMSIPNINIETIDPHTVNFKIPTRFSPFVSLLNIPLINKDTKVAGEYSIKLKQRSSGVVTQITLESKQKIVIFSVFPTARQALVAYKLGQVDTVLDLPSDLEEEAGLYGQIQKQPDSNRVVMIIFNQTDPNLKEKSIRQAIAYQIKDKTFGEQESLSPISPKSWSYNPVVKSYAFNPQRSKELVASKVTLELATTPELLKVAESLKLQLDSDIFEINTKVVTSVPDTFQLYLTSFNIPTDPDQYREWHSTQNTNIGKGSDEKIDKLLEDGRITTDQKQRKAIYFDFQKTFAEELPALTLYNPSIFTITRKPQHLDYFK